MKIADEDDGRAEGRDAAFASAVIPARRGIFAVAAVVGLEKKFNISYRYGQKGCPKLRELAPVASAITQPTRHTFPISVNKARSGKTPPTHLRVFFSVGKCNDIPLKNEQQVTAMAARRPKVIEIDSAQGHPPTTWQRSRPPIS